MYLQHWTRISRGPTGPGARYGHAACVIPATITGHPLLLVVGGVADHERLGLSLDSWLLDLSSYEWFKVCLPFVGIHSVDVCMHRSRSWPAIQVASELKCVLRQY